MNNEIENRLTSLSSTKIHKIQAWIAAARHIQAYSSKMAKVVSEYGLKGLRDISKLPNSSPNRKFRILGVVRKELRKLGPRRIKSERLLCRRHSIALSNNK